MPDAFQKSGDPPPPFLSRFISLASQKICAAQKFLSMCVLGMCCAGDAAEDILARFERERKHVPVKRKVGAGFDLGFPT